MHSRLEVIFSEDWKYILRLYTDFIEKENYKR